MDYTASAHEVPDAGDLTGARIIFVPGLKPKPEPDVYRHALERLGVGATETWMVGDNLEWEVETPQRLGMVGIWYDPFDAGVPATATARPTRIIKRLSELVE